MSDVFSFGIIMYEVASQSLPYRNMTVTQTMGRKQRWGDPCSVAGDVPKELKELMASCIDPNPNRRPCIGAVCSCLTKIILEVIAMPAS